MKLIQVLSVAFQYVSEAVVRVFAPSNDHYPATGMIPFQGDPYESRWAD